MQTTIEGYPLAFAIEQGTREPVSLFLYDLPGCGVQAASFEGALAKLRLLVPEYLRLLRDQGVAVPEPSPEPAFQFEQMGWMVGPFTVPREGASAAEPKVDIGQTVFEQPVPA